MKQIKNMFGEYGVRPERTMAQHYCRLCSIGHTLLSPGSDYYWDNRTRGEMALFQFTLAGEGRFKDLDGTGTRVLTAGEAFMVAFPSNTMYWLPESKSWEFLYIVFSGDAAMHHARMLTGRHGHLMQMDPDSDPVRTVAELFMEVAGGTRPDDYHASAMIYSFIMNLYRVVEQEPGMLPDAVRTAVDFIQSNFSDPGLDVETIARAAGYSRFHFTRLFKEHMGVGPYEFVLRTRLQRAMEMLASGDIPVKKIAESVGFTEYCYFCNAFRKHTGQTPGSVRRQYRRFGARSIV